jgi:hypothetical protein
MFGVRILVLLVTLSFSSHGDVVLYRNDDFCSLPNTGKKMMKKHRIMPGRWVRHRTDPIHMTA